LVVAQLDLEKNITAEKQRQKEIDDMMKLRPLTEVEEEKAKAKEMKRLEGEQVPLVLAATEEVRKSGMYAERRQMMETNVAEDVKKLEKLQKDKEIAGQRFGVGLPEIEAAIKKTTEHMLRTKSLIEDNDKAMKDAAKDLVAKAFKGQDRAFSDIERAAAAHPEIVSQDIREKLARVAPEGRQKTRDIAAEIDAALQSQLDEAKDAIDKAKENARLMDKYEAGFDQAAKAAKNEAERAADAIARDTASYVKRGMTPEAAEKQAREEAAARAKGGIAGAVAEAELQRKAEDQAKAAKAREGEEKSQEGRAASEGLKGANEARTISAMRPDASEAEVLSMAAISRDLQQAGARAIDARNRAIQEMMNYAHGHMEVFNAMRMQDMNFIAQFGQIRNVMQQEASQMSGMSGGNP